MALTWEEEVSVLVTLPRQHVSEERYCWGTQEWNHRVTGSLCVLKFEELLHCFPRYCSVLLSYLQCLRVLISQPHQHWKEQSRPRGEWPWRMSEIRSYGERRKRVSISEITVYKILKLFTLTTHMLTIWAISMEFFLKYKQVFAIYILFPPLPLLKF